MKRIFQLTCLLAGVTVSLPTAWGQSLHSQPTRELLTSEVYSQETAADRLHAGSLGHPQETKTGGSRNRSQAGGRGRPRTPGVGGSRGCVKQLPIPLAIEGMEFTYQERPTFWVYIPYEKEQLIDGKLRFSLRDRKENPIYEREVNISGEAPGVVGISLPSDVPALDLETWYKWRVFIDVYCPKDGEEQVDSLALIFRENSNSSEIYEESFVYDRLTKIALSESAEERQQQWLQFLQSIGLEESQEVLKDKCCTLLDSLPPVSNE